MFSNFVAFLYYLTFRYIDSKLSFIDSAERESFYALLNSLWSYFRTKTEFSTHAFNFLTQLLCPENKQVYWEIESRMQLAGLHCMQHHKESKNPSFAWLAKHNCVKCLWWSILIFHAPVSWNYSFTKDTFNQFIAKTKQMSWTWQS